MTLQPAALIVDDGHILADHGLGDLSRPGLLNIRAATSIGSSLGFMRHEKPPKSAANHSEMRWMCLEKHGSHVSCH